MPRLARAFDSKAARLVCVSLAAIGILTGCNNPPGALELTITPEKPIYSPGEPIRLAATFHAREGTICIERGRSSSFSASLQNVETGATLKGAMIAQCGMLGLLFIPVWPVMIAATRLDVADVGGRFAVVTPDRPQTISLVIQAENDMFYLSVENSWEHRQLEGRVGQLPPGRYRMDVAFESDVKPRLLMPLFWHVYDQPVSADVEFVVGPPV